MRDTARLDVPYPAEGPISQAALAGLRRVTVEREGRRLIDGLSLGLPPDGITVIMGANGAGKSVCLRLLHGLIAPDDGQVTWRDRPLDDAARRQQSLVFQKPVLLRRSAGANIDFVLKARGRHDPARRDALLAHVGLGDHAGRPARSLSGGEQQRLALARALATDPCMLLLDEPTASLDPASTAAVERIIAASRDEGRKVVLVTHDPGQARRLADDVAFLHRGKLVEHRPAVSFLAAPQSVEAAAFLDGRLAL